MEIEITKDMIESIGIGRLKRFGVDEDWDRWHSHQQIDLNGWSDEDIDYLKGLLESITQIRKVKSRLYDIKLFMKSKNDDDSSKIYKISHLRSLMINYLKNLQHHWIFKTAHEDSNVRVGYYVEDIEFHPKVNRSYNQEAKPAYVAVGLVYEKFGETQRTHIHFEEGDVYGKTISQVLSSYGYVVEDDNLIENYDKEIKRYGELFPLIGSQFTVTGTADGEHSSSWKKSSFTFPKDRSKNRVVIDTLSDDEDKDGRKGYGNRDVGGYFWNKYGDRDDDEYDEGIEDATSARGRVPIHPFLKIFDLCRHIRMSTHVTNLEEYVYDENLSEKLILPENIKSLITLLVEHKDSNFKDIVAGKGGGAIVLLTGLPGVGKTLTAEVFAETEKKPLYSVQASQLGTNPNELEKNLMMVLKRAKRWNAVMLLDESDVYVHERGDDLVQNAIVGVFLRVLEYHASVLFLTTNRPDLVDDAIASRCVARIDYKYPSKEDQRKIWKVLSESSNIEIEQSEIEIFTNNHEDISGRDIKNLIKLASLISTSTKKPIDNKLLEYVLQFKPTNKSVKNNDRK